MRINELCKNAHENARDHGFWDDIEKIENPLIDNAMNNAVTTRIMLIVCELAEATEALREYDADNFREELADIAIRLADLCGGLEIDLEAEIAKKMLINKDRPYKHGKLF